MLAPHSLCPRHSRQSLDCLRWRVLRACSTITTPSALFPGISRGCTWRSGRRQFRSSRFCRIRFNRAIRSACHLRHLALRRCASLCNISASAQADSAYAERNAPSLASAALPPRSTQATAPHARSLPYSTCRRIALPYSIGCCSEMWALPPQPYSIQNRRPRGFCALPARASSGVSYGVSVTAYAYIVSNVCLSVSCCTMAAERRP